jgi:hypothetical protein
LHESTPAWFGSEEWNTGDHPRKEDKAMTKTRDLTISEALRDPLIAMVMRADGVKLDDFKQLLETAARKREPRSPVSGLINAIANRTANNSSTMCCFG